MQIIVDYLAQIFISEENPHFSLLKSLEIYASLDSCSKDLWVWPSPWDLQVRINTLLVNPMPVILRHTLKRWNGQNYLLPIFLIEEIILDALKIPHIRRVPSWNHMCPKWNGRAQLYNPKDLIVGMKWVPWYPNTHRIEIRNLGPGPQ